MNRQFSTWGTFALVAVGLVFAAGCPQSRDDGGAVSPSSDDTTQTPARTSTADAADVEAAKALVDRLGGSAKCTLLPEGVLTAIVIPDGSTLTAENITLLGKLNDLEKLQVLNYRDLNDEMVAQLQGLKNLTSLALTNSVIGDPAVEMIVTSFPDLTEIDLSSNPNLTNRVLKVICQLSKLERLTLVQNRFTDVGTRHLSKLENLRVLDLRGNMEAGDMTMEIIGTLPKLAALKHRSTAVSDYGLEYLAASKSLRSLLMQDFGVNNQAGEFIAKIGTLTELEVFRCQGLGSDGVLALKGMKLTRLKLRDLPMVDDQAMAVFSELPVLKRLELHELPSVSDYGLESLASLQSLEVLDIWALPQVTEATIEKIAKLPNLKELSLRETGISDTAIDVLLAMPNLQSLTLKDNGSLTPEGLKKLSGQAWTKLDTGEGSDGG